MKSVDPARIGLAADTVHKFYTGFSWKDIQEIANAVNKVRKTDDFFDYPDYGGLPKRISKRLSPDQVDILNSELPKTVNEVAHLLCYGEWAR